MIKTKTLPEIKPYFNYFDVISKVTSQGAKILDLCISTDKAYIRYQYKFPHSPTIYEEEIFYNALLDETLKWIFKVGNKSITVYEK